MYVLKKNQQHFNAPHMIVWGYIVLKLVCSFIRLSCFLSCMQLLWCHWSNIIHI